MKDNYSSLLVTIILILCASTHHYFSLSTGKMGRLAPLVIRLMTASLVAFVLAEPGPGNGTDHSVARVNRDTAVPAPATVPPPPPRRAGKRERNRKRTTTTTTTVDPNDDDVADATTPITTTTVDPRAFDHSKCFFIVSDKSDAKTNKSRDACYDFALSSCLSHRHLAQQ